MILNRLLKLIRQNVKIWKKIKKDNKMFYFCFYIIIITTSTNETEIKMTTQINATQMKQGDLISFYGAEFILDEVKSTGIGTKDEVYWAKGICLSPSESMMNDTYFYDAITGECSWVFQGNANRKLIKLN
jgi:hypothetical protein